MKISKARVLLVVLCIAVLIITAGTAAFLTITGNNSSFSSENTATDFINENNTATVASDVDMWTTGFPDGTIYGFTNYDWGVSMSKGETGTDGKLLHTTDMDSVKVVKSGYNLGTKSNPRVINTKADWDSFVGYINGKTSGANAYGKDEYFVLNSDIDFAGATISMMTYFAGNLYGNNYRLVRPKYTNSGDVSINCLAIVQRSLSGCYISDLGIQDYFIDATGSLFYALWMSPILSLSSGNGTDATIANCVTTGEIRASMTYAANSNNHNFTSSGGIVSKIENGGSVRIYKCSCSYKSIVTKDNVQSGWLMRAGIVGTFDDNRDGLAYTSSLEMFDCFSSLVGTSTGIHQGILSGGLVGFIRRTKYLNIQNCVCIQNTNDPSMTWNSLGSLFSLGETAIAKDNNYTINNVYSWSQSIIGGTNWGVPMMGRYNNSLTSTASFAYNYSQLATPASNNMTGATTCTAYSELWNQVTNNLDPNGRIWIIGNVTDINATSYSSGFPAVDLFENPVHTTKARITYSKSDDTDWDFGNDDSGNKKPNVIEYDITQDGITALPTAAAPDSNHEFVGWTLDKANASSKTYKIYSRDIVGNRKMYPVWKIADFEASITITSPDAAKFPVSGSNITTTYSSDRANVVTLTASATATPTLGAKYYQWYVDGNPIENATNQTLTVHDVDESGRYTVKVNSACSSDLLWRGEDVSDEAIVTIEKGAIKLKNGSFALVGEAYIGQPFDTVKYSASAVDAATGATLAGKFDNWSNQLPITLPDGETEVTNWICFYPDDSIKNNYVLDRLGRAALEVKVTPSQLNIEFTLATVGGDVLEMPILYNMVTSAEEIRAGFNKLYAKYYAGLPDNSPIKANLNNLAPKIGGTFIDEYKTDLPGQKAPYPITVTFEARKFTFTFDPMGGTLASGMDTTHDFFYNDLTKSYIKNPIRDSAKPNDRFQYWYYEVEKDGVKTQVKWDPALDRVTQALTLKAQWRTVTLTLQYIEAEMNPTASLIAQQTIKDGDLIVTAFYLDDNGDPYDEKLEFGDYSIVYNPGDGKLHVGSSITIKYSYKNVDRDVTMSPTSDKPLVVNPIDLKTEEWDIYLDAATGERKVVMKADGTPKTLNVKNMIPDEDTYFIDLENIKYTYTNLGGIETEPIAKDKYTVKIEFPVRSDDYVAHDIFVELEIKDVTTVFVEWTNSTPYQYNGKEQHPTAVLKDADGVEILAKNWEYYKPTDDEDWTSVKRGHSVCVRLLNDAYEFDSLAEKAAIYEIKKAELAAPTIDGVIEYTGATINIVDHLNGFDPDLMDIAANGASGLNVDTYTAIITIKESVKANADWLSGKASETITWKISKRALTVVWDKTEFYIDNITDAGVNPKVIGFVGMTTDDLSHFDYDNFLIYEGDVDKTEVGTYTIRVKLNSLDYSKNYELKEGISKDYFILSDESMVGVKVVWKGIPVGGYKFNGEIQGPTFENISVQLEDGTDVTQYLLDNDYITLGGDVLTSKWAQAKSYKAIITIDAESGYYIKSGAEQAYKIVKNAQGEGEKPSITQINKPTLEKDEQEYTGSDIEFKLNGFDADKMTITGSLIKKEVGRYSITVSIKDKNKFAWADGSNGDITLEFEITEKGQTVKPGGENGGDSGIDWSKFPKWQFPTSVVSIALIIAFACIWSKFDKRRNQADKNAQKYNKAAPVTALAVSPMVIGTDKLWFGMNTTAWSSVAFVLMGFMVIMLALMLIARSRCLKAEAACEEALEQKEERERIIAAKAEEERIMREAEEKAERLRREEEEKAERRRLEDERQKREDDFKMMMVTMMNSRPASSDSGDVKTIVSEVVASLLPAMQQAYLPQQSIAYIPYQGAVDPQQVAAVSFDEEEDENEEEWDMDEDEDEDSLEAEMMDDTFVIEPEQLPKKLPANFRARLKESSDKNRVSYSIIKNEFCAQKNVAYRVCGRVEKIKFHGDIIAVIGIAKRSIKLWLALDPNEFDKDRYFQKDVSEKPRYAKVPMLVRIGSERAQKRVLELLSALFEKFGIEPRRKYEQKTLQELIFTLKGNKLLKDKDHKQLLSESVHVHDADVLENETAENCIEVKDIDHIDEENFETVSLDTLDEHFADGQKVTLERLKKLALVPDDCNGIRVTAGSRISKPLIVYANEFTLPAVKMIALTGGRAIQLVQF